MPQKSIQIVLIAFVPLIFLLTCQESKKYDETKNNIKFGRIEDPHSFSNPDNISAKHLNLDLEIDWEKHILKGSVSLKLDYKKDNDTLVLDTREISVSKVVNSKGETLNFGFGQKDEIFGTPLYILPAKSEVVTIFYQTDPDCEALQWLSPEQTHDKKAQFLYSQSQAILARSWIPCQDAPAVKFTYNARIKTKKGFLALMSATNPQTLSEDGIYNFEMDQPISSYLLALSSGKLEFKSLGPDCGIYAEEGMLDKAVWEFADMQKMVDEAGKLYGKYMWKRYDVLVLPPSFPFGGMENPRLTFATPTVITGDRSQVSLIAHELAHSWSGNLVTNKTWNDFWLNEGFTNYFEQRIMVQLYGKAYDEMRQVLAWNDLEKTINEMREEKLMADTRLKLDLKNRNPDDGLTDVAYDKGRFFLCHLEKVVGIENWDKFVQSYFKTHAFGAMSTEGFINYLNTELLDKNPAWKEKAQIDDWIFGEGMPKSAIKPKSTELDKVDTILSRYFRGVLKPEKFDTMTFTTHHWQYLIRQFSKKADLTQMKEFERLFRFSNRSNAEITCDWYTTTIKLGYTENRYQIKSFLGNVGRRKFLMPIYRALAQTQEGKTWASNVFNEVKNTYHSVSSKSVEEVLR